MKKKTALLTTILIVLGLGLIGLAVYLAPNIDRFLDVDACLDAGGRVIDGNQCEYAGGRTEKM